jgi:hypothetical protein
MAHSQLIADSHPMVTWRQLVRELRTGQYEASQAWDLLDAICMGTLLLMIAASVLSVLAILLVNAF